MGMEEVTDVDGDWEREVVLTLGGDTVILEGVGEFVSGTLGSGTGRGGVVGVVGTLGSDTGVVDDLVDESEKISLRFKIVANFETALYEGSPACKDGHMVEGGVLRRVPMSVAVCCRKSLKVTFGKGMEWGKKVTVSTTRSDLVFGK